MPSATVLELEHWRLESGGRGDDPIIGERAASGLVQWSCRCLQPAAKRVIDRDDISLYTLRHSGVSACHYAGLTVPAARAELKDPARRQLSL